MTILVALPVTALVLLAAIFRRRAGGWRLAALRAAVAFGALLVLVTEALSPLRLLTPAGLAGAWGGIAVALAAWLWRSRRAVQEERGQAAGEPLAAGYRGLLAALAALLAAVGLTALVAPPNTWDSMAYHMPRVAQWAQAASVRHFPTPYLVQIEHPPFAEFAILHLQVLGGGDRFANAVQWLSLLGSLVAVSLIARQLGAGPRGQVFAAVVAATMPMAILQGSSTQNDLVLSLWLLTFALLVLRAAAAGDLRPGDAAWLGASLGLALGTKGTAYFFAVPFGVWLAAAVIRRMRWRAWQPAAVAAGLALLLNAGHFGRNAALFGRPLSDGGDATNKIRTPAALASVVVRNLSLHVGTPSAAVNDRIDRAVRWLHRPLGLDVDDPRTTCWGSFQIHRLNTSEDSAGNPLQLLLVLGSVAALAGRRALRGAVARHLLAAASGFLLFCLLLKYQPWHARLHTPLFLLLAPAAGLALEGARRDRLAFAAACALLAASLPWLLLNRQRPLVGFTTRSGHHPSILATSRTGQYLAHPVGRHLLEPYRRAADLLRGRARDVGLLLPEDAFEYPLWVLLRSDGVERLVNVGVTNVSARAGDATFAPHAIVRVRESYIRPPAPGPPGGDADPVLDTLQVAGRTYVRRAHFGTVDVLERQDPVSGR